MKLFITVVVIALALCSVHGQEQLDQEPNSHAALLQVLRESGFNSFVDVVSASPHLLKALHGAHSSDEAPQPTWKATVLAPTDAAVASWLKSMALTMEDLQSRPMLAAMVAGYHLILDDALELPAALTSPSLVVSTASPSWDITLSMEPGSSQVVATDAQNRTGLVSAQPAARYGDIIVYSVDTLLMSGDFFTTLAAALNYFPQLTSIRIAIERVEAMQALADSPEQELTWFLPMDKGVGGRGVDTRTEPLENLAFELPYHILAGPIQSIPAGIMGTKQYGTMLTGTVLSVEFSKPKAVPVVPGSKYKVMSALATVITQDEDTSLVVVPNIFVGRSILHVLAKTILAPPTVDMPVGLFNKLYGPGGLAKKLPKNLELFREFFATRTGKAESKALLAATPAVKVSRRMLSHQTLAADPAPATIKAAPTAAANQFKPTGPLADTVAHLLASVQGAVIVAEPGMSRDRSQQLQHNAAKAGYVSYNGARHLFA